MLYAIYYNRMLCINPPLCCMLYITIVCYTDKGGADVCITIIDTIILTNYTNDAYYY
jgi:hypothetical protein